MAVKLGVDFALKVLDWDNSTTIRLQLWDINGMLCIKYMERAVALQSVLITILLVR